jgi:hypothetical protein
MMVTAIALAGCEASPPHPDSVPADRLVDSPTVPRPIAPAHPAVHCGPLEGAWEGKDENDQKVLRRFADGRLVRWSQGRAMVFRVVACGAAEITFKFQGQKLAIKYEVHDDELTLIQGMSRSTSRRLKTVPEELLLRPVKLGPSTPVAADRLGQIQKELANRLQEDQRIREKLMDGLVGEVVEQMQKIDGDNTQYVKRLITELGWIDAGRFGREASTAAFMIVQHSGDLPLMLAALPEIEKDVQAGKADGQDFALLYDRTQLSLGNPQRYGSQIGQANGKTVVLPVEDREKVDEYRKSMGMMPLTDYLKLFGVSIEKVEFLQDD